MKWTHHFFKLPYKKIDIVIHRESAIHALIELRDKVLFACLYHPDMRMPIAFSLFYPLRPKISNFKEMDFRKNLSFTFQPINYDRFPLLKMILESSQRNDNSLSILNACDEVAIDYFIKGKIKFLHLYKVMDYIFSSYPSKKIKNIKDIFYWDNWSRAKTKEYLEAKCY